MKPKNVSHIVIVLSAIVECFQKESAALLVTALRQIMAALEREVATHDDIKEACSRAKCSRASSYRMARIMRALADVSGKTRAKRHADLAKCSDLKAAAQLCSDEGWGVALTLKGKEKQTAGGRPKGTAQAKGASKETDAVTGLRKLTQNALIEFVAARAAKNPAFRAALLAALNAEDAPAETE